MPSIRYDVSSRLSSLIAEHVPDLGAAIAQLKKEREKLDRAIEALSGVVGSPSSRGRGRSARRTLSPAARKGIGEAQRVRWAKVKARAGKKTARCQGSKGTRDARAPFLLLLPRN